MKQVWLVAIVFIAQLPVCRAGNAVCIAPPPFSHDIPDGASASRDAMLSTQHILKVYDNAVMTYATCLRDSGQSMHEADSTDQDLRQLASRFNEQLKIFKERNGAN